MDRGLETHAFEAGAELHRVEKTELFRDQPEERAHLHHRHELDDFRAGFAEEQVCQPRTMGANHEFGPLEHQYLLFDAGSSKLDRLKAVRMQEGLDLGKIADGPRRPE